MLLRSYGYQGHLFLGGMLLAAESLSIRICMRMSSSPIAPVYIDGHHDDGRTGYFTWELLDMLNLLSLTSGISVAGAGVGLF